MSKISETLRNERTPEIWDEDYVAPKKEKSLKQTYHTYTVSIGKDGQEYGIAGTGTRLERYNVESQDYNGYKR